ncbi:hypothetical protein WJX75_005166 [Coccomyxa subellipsoidea]|uniref:Uncharacterized protein n=1 Tax=Coccomyxa subellipsoidea TaxID=248742 RepID=A0ABR2Z3N9_9CHLO
MSTSTALSDCGTVTVPPCHWHARLDYKSSIQVCASLPSRAHDKLVIVERNGKQFACNGAVGGVLLALASAA